MNEISGTTAIILLFGFFIIILILIKKSQMRREEKRLVWEESKRLSEEYEEKIKKYSHNHDAPTSPYREIINKINQSSEKASNQMSNYLDAYDSEVDTTFDDTKVNAVIYHKIEENPECLGSNTNNNQILDFITIENVLTKYCGKSTEVVIPETVEKLDNNAFEGCVFIKSLTIPDSVKKIGEESLSDLKNLTRLYMPKGRFNNLLLPINKNLRVYERESITDSLSDFYTITLSRLFVEISNISIPFSPKPPLDRLIEMEDELESLFDYYFVKNLKGIKVSNKIIEMVENKELIKLLLSTIQFEIAVIYFDSVFSNRAVTYYEYSSNNGNIDATFNLANLYGMGLLVEKNNEKSFLLMKQCAEKGHADAMFIVAQQYQNGVGTSIDIEQAKKWYYEAGKNGNDSAWQILRNI